MKLSLGARLSLSYLLVILVGMGLLTPLAWLTVERLYLDTQSANLLEQARLVAATLRSEAPAASAPLPYSQTSNVLPGIHTRLIDAQGAVVIELAAPGKLPAGTGLSMPTLAQNAAGLVTAEELTQRAEIAQALQGHPATAIRRLASGQASAGGKRVLYAAAPVLAQDGSVIQVVYLATPLPDTQWSALPDLIRWQFIAAFLFALLLASAAGLLLARRISRPLDKLAGAARAVAAGDLNQSVPVDTPLVELAVLGQAFNTMTANLRQADQAKTAFISDVSHELRTPLTVIKGTLETLQDGAIDDLPARAHFLDSMNRETERLIRLVNDLLVLTRADAGALNLQLHPLDLSEMARSRCQHLAPIANARQVSLRVIPAPQSVRPVLADPDRLSQVLDNLLDNAIRYAPSGSDVTLTLTQEADQAACQIADTGPGIPAQHLPFIFERFYRADNARGRGQGGSGLGLAIVRSLVLAQAGHVTVSSIEGHGAAFTIWLPLAPNLNN
jgi:signal transduction histidine kinase